MLQGGRFAGGTIFANSALGSLEWNFIKKTVFAEHFFAKHKTFDSLGRFWTLL